MNQNISQVETYIDHIAATRCSPSFTMMLLITIWSLSHKWSINW